MHIVLFATLDAACLHVVFHNVKALYVVCAQHGTRVRNNNKHEPCAHQKENSKGHVGDRFYALISFEGAVEPVLGITVTIRVLQRSVRIGTAFMMGCTWMIAPFVH